MACWAEPVGFPDVPSRLGRWAGNRPNLALSGWEAVRRTFTPGDAWRHQMCVPVLDRAERLPGAAGCAATGFGARAGIRAQRTAELVSLVFAAWILEEKLAGLPGLLVDGRDAG